MSPALMLHLFPTDKLHPYLTRRSQSGHMRILTTRAKQTEALRNGLDWVQRARNSTRHPPQERGVCGAGLHGTRPNCSRDALIEATATASIEMHRCRRLPARGLVGRVAQP